MVCTYGSGVMSTEPALLSAAECGRCFAVKIILSWFT